MYKTRSQIEWERVQNANRSCAFRYRIQSLQSVSEQEPKKAWENKKQDVQNHGIYNRDVLQGPLSRNPKGFVNVVEDKPVHPLQRSKTSPDLSLQQRRHDLEDHRLKTRSVTALNLHTKEYVKSKSVSTSGQRRELHRPSTVCGTFGSDGHTDQRTKSDFQTPGLQRAKTWTHSNFYRRSPDKDSKSRSHHIFETSTPYPWSQSRAISRLDELALPKFRGLAKGYGIRRPRSVLELRHLDLKDYDALRNAENETRKCYWMQ